MSILKKRLTKQGETLNELKKMMQEIKNQGIVQSNNMMHLNAQTSPMYTSSLQSVYERSPNPWTVKTNEALNLAINMLSKNVRERVSRSSTDVYEKTIDALKNAKHGLSAEEVGKVTNRNRNTESAYLWRLHLAGLVDRKKKGSTVVYSLRTKSDAAKILQTL